MMDAGPEILCMHGTISCENGRNLCLISASAQTLKRLKEKEQAATEMTVIKGEFQGEWTTPAPDFTAI